MLATTAESYHLGEMSGRRQVPEELRRDSASRDGTGATTKPPKLSMHGGVENLKVFRCVCLFVCLSAFFGQNKNERKKMKNFLKLFKLKYFINSELLGP